MGVILKEKNFSSTRKRFDFRVEKRGFFGDMEMEFGMRIVSNIELSGDEVLKIAEKTCDRWAEKRETKSGKWYVLGFPNATAYIAKEKEEAK